MDKDMETESLTHRPYLIFFVAKFVFVFYLDINTKYTLMYLCTSICKYIVVNKNPGMNSWYHSGCCHSRSYSGPDIKE